MSRDDDFNPILVKEYRDYHYEIYLDAERECLVGAILEFNGYGDCDSDSLTHLIEQIKRRIDEEIHYNYQNRLAREIRELEKQAEEYKERLHYYGRMLKIVDEVGEEND